MTSEQAQHAIGGRMDLPAYGPNPAHKGSIEGQSRLKLVEHRSQCCSHDPPAFPFALNSAGPPQARKGALLSRKAKEPRPCSPFGDGASRQF